MLDFFARWYASKLQHRLGRMGLTYHDAIAETGVHEKALSRLPPEYLLQRNRRLKRAFDLSQKHAELPPSMQENAFREFDKVQAVFAQTQKDNDERAAINDGAFAAADADDEEGGRKGGRERGERRARMRLWALREKLTRRARSRAAARERRSLSRTREHCAAPARH